jgi:hypothetical protein
MSQPDAAKSLKLLGASLHHYLGVPSWGLFAVNRDPLMAEYSHKPATDKHVHAYIHSGSNQARDGAAVQAALCDRSGSCSLGSLPWLGGWVAAGRCSGLRRAHAAGSGPAAPPQVSPSKYMDTIAAMEPEVYVALVDEVRAALPPSLPPPPAPSIRRSHAVRPTRHAPRAQILAPAAQTPAWPAA